MIKKYLLSFWAYLGELQGRHTRMVHAILAILVILQITNSNFMHVHSHLHVFNWATWVHIVMGITTGFFLCVLMGTVFIKRGFQYFYPYLFGDFKQLQSDIKQLLKRQLPEATPGGLAAIVQGLGLGALTLVALSGIMWFIAWHYHWGIAHDIKETHETLTGLIEAYIIGHGGMGVLHFLIKANKR